MDFLRSPEKPLAIRRTGDDTPAASIWGYIWRMTGLHQVCVAALALMVAGLNLAPLELQRRIIDGAIVEGDVDLLVLLGGLYVAAFVGLRVAKFALRLYQGWLSESAIRYTRHHLGRLYSEGGQSGSRRPGEAVSIIGSETDKLGGFVGEGISSAVSNAAVLLGITAYMLIVEPRVALVALGVFLPQVLLVPLMQRRLNRLTEKRVEYLRGFGQRIAEDDVREGQPTVGLVDRIYRNRVRFYLWKFLMKGLLNLLNGIGPIIVLTYGGWLAIQGATTVGVLVAFMSGFERLANPVRELITFYRNAEQARVQHNMIADWMMR